MLRIKDIILNREHSNEKGDKYIRCGRSKIDPLNSNNPQVGIIRFLLKNNAANRFGVTEEVINPPFQIKHIILLIQSLQKESMNWKSCSEMRQENAAL